MDESIPLPTRNEAERPRSRKTEVPITNQFIKIASICSISCVHIFSKIWQDTKAISNCVWIHRRQLCLIAVLSFILLAAFTGSGLSLLLPPKDYWRLPYCTPGGNFDYNAEYNPWSLEHIFQITLSFGKLTFAQAKAIDIVWDVIVGRGGQFVLSKITFNVFSKCITRLLERENSFILYNTFRAIVFEDPSLRSTGKLAQDLTSQLDWRARLSIMWFILASVYVVAFPTILSAMTGYSSNVVAYFRITDSKSPIPNNDYFHRAIYLINDADRIERAGFNGTYLVGSRGFDSLSTTPDDDYEHCLINVYYENFECGLAFGVSKYIETYGASPLQNTSSYLNITTAVWGPGDSDTRTYNISSPTLNMSVFNTTAFGRVYANYYNPNPKPLSTGNNPGNQLLTPMYTTSEGIAVYNSTDINNNRGTCDSQTTYNWGFSFLLLFIFFIVTTVWVLGMYVMWSETFWNSSLDRVGRGMGFYRGVSDINNAMSKDMLRDLSELDSETKIREKLSTRRNGGKIELEHINRSRLPKTRKVEFQGWKKDIALLNGWTKPWTAVHWTWFFIFNCVCGITARLVMLLEFPWRDRFHLVGAVMWWLVGGTIWVCFGLPMVAMLLTGLGCTWWRWTKRLVRLVWRPRHEHTRIPDAVEDSAEPL